MSISFYTLSPRVTVWMMALPQFHPLYPWLATPLAAIMGQPLLALLLVSSLATLGLLIAFEYLARLDLAPPAARTSTLLLILAPPAFILFAPYTESLFLLCSVLCILWAREQRWWLAGLAGALATLTRQQGLFLLLPLAWEMWEVSNRQWRHLLLAWRSWLALALVPAGMLVWIIYRALALGDVQANFSNPQALIYSVLISPSASKVVPEQAFLWPWDVLWVAAQNYQLSPGQNIVDLVLGAGFLVLLVVAWPNMRISYRIYAVVVTLVSFSYYTGPLQPYMGLSRHLLLAFPVFIGLGPVIRPGLTRLLLLTLSSFGFFFLIFVYVIRAWVP
ncbi:MAG: hypothetical protein HC837_09550 [Chloroflexaceae bacterium]|nr:hypothetical protein [Chloroflexaceae bacterium]